MKRIFVFVVASLSVIHLFAQEKPVFGIKGGLNIATFNPEGNENYDSKFGVHLGALAHIHLAKQWALQPELVFSQQGAEFSAVIGSGERVETEFKANYINLPVMIQYMFDNGFRLETGPQLGVLVSDEELLKKTDISWGFGLSYLTYSGLGVGARYNLGLSNINDFIPENKLKNSVFQLGVFYMLDKQHKRKSK
jgi:hypothetical protein